MKDLEKASRAESEARRKAEAKELDPLLFPFEEYYFVGPKSPRGSDPLAIDRALTLPPGDYDVYIAMLDQTRKGRRARPSSCARR